MGNEQIASRLRSLIDESLIACGRDEVVGNQLSDDAFLPEYLDSVVLSALIVNMEDEWGFEIADEEIEPEIFEDLKTLATFVESKLG